MLSGHWNFCNKFPGILTNKNKLGIRFAFWILKILKDKNQFLKNLKIRLLFLYKILEINNRPSQRSQANNLLDNFLENRYLHLF